MMEATPGRSRAGPACRATLSREFRLAPQFTLPRLMLVTDRHRTRGRNLVTVVADAVEGGVGIVQFHEPDRSDDELIELVRRIRRVVPAGTQLVVNGSPQIAAAAHAGLHVPAGAEAAVERCARVREQGLLYGRTVREASEAGVALEEQASYLLVGSVGTGSPGCDPQLVREIGRAVAPMPVFAGGAVTAARVPQLIHAGAYGVAVCQGILSASHPRRVAQALGLALEVAGAAGQHHAPDRLF